MAEKLETILSRVELNGRIRDYYDIYLIWTRDYQNININHFKEAVKKTFNKRGYNGDINKTINIIRNSKILENYWNLYSKKNKYANNIEYQDIIKCIDELTNKIIEIKS